MQVPPRGLWAKSGQPVLTTAQAWLGRDLETAPSPSDLVRRYLGAFGPATVADMQTWSGLTGLRDIVQRLRPGLRTFRDEHGRELLDLPDAPRPGPDVPAPLRLLAPFDNLLLSHADRTRVITTEHRTRLFATGNAVIPGTVLIDGFVAGVWKLKRHKRSAIVTITPYRPIAKRHTAGIHREGHRLLAFAAPDAETPEVEILPAEVL